MNREPIAIVGIACRFPGDVTSPDELASLLRSKRTGIAEVPTDRWDKDAFYHPDFRKLGHIHVRRGGFLSRIGEFDAAFFGISPNEAKRMDPQQRLVLETAFAAIEDAGTRLDQLAGRSVAVTVGAGLSDYGGLTAAVTERRNVAGTTNTGSALSIVANRVSYLFDLRGPSFTVDTACSSSLTAIHLACSAIWDGSAEAALTGGVNVILKPETTLGFSKGGYLSPDEQCRAFSDDANGYVRSEGVAIALLKPLGRALADGDRIYALIRNTRINQDGRTAGMTVPSQAAQEDLLRLAFEGAGVDPARVAYVEAHGTGTPAGDPIEASAIGAVVGRASGRNDRCYIGSVKTNLGHMEFAAGMGGLVKLALVLSQREVLPNIGFRRSSPKLDLDALGLRVPTDCVRLPDAGPLFGGLNSFGFGGANGHIVLESPPPPPARKTISTPRSELGQREARPHAFVLSARSQSALLELAGAVSDQIRNDATPLDDLAAALMHRRSQFDFRAAIVGSDRKQIAVALDEFARTGSATDDLFVGRPREGRSEKVGFVFTGQGAQWFAMGRALLATNDTFREAIELVEGELQRLGWLAEEKSTLRAELERDEAHSRIGETQIAQPCLFALQIGLARVLAESGVRPAAVVGHSIGELAAAVVCGALSLPEAIRIVFWRSRSQATAEGKGAMAAVGMTEQAARDLVGRFAGEVEIAAVNGPTALTLAGSHAAIDAIVSELQGTQTFCRRLAISVPFHCHLMDPVENGFRAGLGLVTSQKADIPFYSTVTGLAHEEALDLDYWYRNIRQPVLYADALRAMMDSGVTCFVEVGPHPALMHGSLDTLRERGARPFYVSTLRREGEDARELARMCAKLFVGGAPCEPPSDAPGANFVALPRYPFERSHFWLETEAGRKARMYPAARIHPHVGRIERSVQAKNVFSCELVLDPKVDTYLAEHIVQDHIVFPAAGQMDAVLAAARHVYGATDIILEGVEFRRPMVLSKGGDEPTTFKLEVYGDDGHFVIASQVGDVTDASWIEHTRGRVRRSASREAPRFDLAELRERITVAVPSADRYRAFSRAGLELGPVFRGIVRCDRSESRTEGLAEIEPPAAIALERDRFVFHPVLIDASLQPCMPVDAERGDAQPLHLPYSFGELRFYGPVPKGRIWAYIRQQSSSSEQVVNDIDVMDDDGVVFMRGSGFVARIVHGAGARFGAGLVYDHAWRPSARPGDDVAPSSPRQGVTAGSWVVLMNGSSLELGRAVEHELRRAGGRVIRAFAGTTFSQSDNDVFSIRPGHAGDADALVAAAGESIAGVVHLWSCDLDDASDDPALDGVRSGAIPLVPLHRGMERLGQQPRDLVGG